MEFDEYFSAENVIRVFNSRIKDSNNIGVDGMSAKKFEQHLDEQVDIIVRKCRKGTYQFTRFKEKLISKGAHSKPRQISIPTIRDAVVLRILCDFLTKKFSEQRLKLPYCYIEDIQKILENPDAGDTFLRLDVKEFYPSIDRKILKEKLELGKISNTAVNLIIGAVTNQTGFKKPPSIGRDISWGLSISNIRALINCFIATIINRAEIRNSPMGRGIPQGLSISNILASIYFSGTDEKLELRSGKRYKRYVDDILFICKATEYKALYKYTKKLLRSELRLSIHEPDALNADKSTVRPTYEGVDYLGFHITDSHLKVRERSHRKVFNSIMNLLTLYTRNYESYPIGRERDRFRNRIFWKLNLRITGCRFYEKSIGWMFFFRQTKDMQQINELDAFVTKILRERKLSAYRKQIKKFIRTYHEILYNRDHTSYIPDFDNSTKEYKIAKIAMLDNLDDESENYLWHLCDDKIDKRFQNIIEREVQRMEREIVDFAKGYY